MILDGDRNDVEEQLVALLDELREFDPQMLQKSRLVMINKIDLWDAAVREEKTEQYHWADFWSSAKTGEGIERVLGKLETVLQEAGGR